MIETQEGKVYVRQFDSVADLLERCTADTDMAEGGRASLRQETPDYRGGGCWSGAKDWSEAEELARFGWAKGPRQAIADASRMVKEDLRPMLQTTFRTTFDVSGQYVDMGRFLTGEPENMVTLQPVKESRHGKVITLVAAGTVSAGTSTEAMVKRGAAIVGLIECLELMQHTVEVFVEFSIGVGGFGRGDKASRLTYLVKVKDAKDALDIDRLAFTLANPAMLRRLIFAAQEREKPAVRNKFGIGYGYGAPIRDVQEGKRVGSTVNIGTLPHGGTAEDWIRDHLKDFGLLA